MEYIQEYKKYILLILLLVIGIFIYLGYTYYMKNVNIKNINDNLDKNVNNLKNNDKNLKVEFNDDFIRTDGFIGAKKGYVFKNDKNGLGYYKEK
jgi:uncharacterized membrane protein SpoIIM required for sporulation